MADCGGFVYSGVMRSPAWAGAVNDAKDTDALDALFAGLPPTLTVEDVSELLNISRQNSYAWLREGVIPGYKIGTTWRVIRDELKETMRRSANVPHRREPHRPHPEEEQEG